MKKPSFFLIILLVLTVFTASCNYAVVLTGSGTVSDKISDSEQSTATTIPLSENKVIEWNLNPMLEGKTAKIVVDTEKAASKQALSGSASVSLYINGELAWSSSMCMGDKASGGIVLLPSTPMEQANQLVIWDAQEIQGRLIVKYESFAIIGEGRIINNVKKGPMSFDVSDTAHKDSIRTTFLASISGLNNMLSSETSIVLIDTTGSDLIYSTEKNKIRAKEYTYNFD